jgi:hypothetical protein
VLAVLLSCGVAILRGGTAVLLLGILLLDLTLIVRSLGLLVTPVPMLCLLTHNGAHVTSSGNLLLPQWRNAHDCPRLPVSTGQELPNPRKAPEPHVICHSQDHQHSSAPR